MGMGIWSMHYIGMLAFSLPITVAYHWPTVAASLLRAILASGVAQFVVSRLRMSLLLGGLGSVAMGSGIAALHYTGMAAMRLKPSAAIPHSGERINWPGHRGPWLEEKSQHRAGECSHPGDADQG